MNTKKYRWLLYTITLTIVATISVQVYWNYKNYKQNKQRVTNEIQLSLDNALEEYYASLAKNDYLTIIETQLQKEDSTHIHNSNIKSGILKSKIVGWNSNGNQRIDTVFKTLDIEINSKRKNFSDSITLKSHTNEDIKKFKFPSQYNEIRVVKGFNTSDSLQVLNNLKTIFISLSNSNVDYIKLDSLLKKQLKSKNLNVDYNLNHFKNDSLIFNSKNNIAIFKGNNVNSKSTYLKNKEEFKLLFKDSSIEALRRSSTGILLSLLLSLAIISCLFYLLKIINKQKELAEIKNDLISNITHEFKTPITTVSTALEAIETFNAIDDKEKTKKYLTISTIQLKKLNHMVEKLLETATLDSEKLLLKKEQVDLVSLVKSTSLKDKFLSTEKNIQFNSTKAKFIIDIDPFHFENAIANLLDNAIKYGGNLIEVHLNFVLNNIEITVADNGLGIEKNQREKIFDKFYRIPKGNTHNIKGFGIGLYYTKKIIEKHGGEIQLLPNTTNTIFKIILPL